MLQANYKILIYVCVCNIIPCEFFTALLAIINNYDNFD